MCTNDFYVTYLYWQSISELNTLFCYQIPSNPPLTHLPKEGL
jgi:hypothetical protein